ncbi:MAG: PAS domain-containing protein [Pseudomonadota bacterium]
MGMELTSAPQGDDLAPLACFNIISRYHCIARFGLGGIVEAVNETFLSTFGYNEAELIGAHHRMLLVDSSNPDPAYERMWSDFSDGVARKGEVLRRAKSGDVLWLQAVYCPVFDDRENVASVLKVATLKKADLVDNGVDVPLMTLSQNLDSLS